MPDGDIRGDAVNCSARVCAAAHPGEVWVTGAIADALWSAPADVESTGTFNLKGIGPTALSRVKEWTGPEPATENPFVWRAGIRSAGAFFGRESEQRELTNAIRGGGSRQVVGPRRIGKTSLLLQADRKAHEWHPGSRPVYLSDQDPRSRTRESLLAFLLTHLGEPEQPPTEVGLIACVENLLANGHRPVVLFDEFEEALGRRSEFDRDFLLTLRTCAEKGASLITCTLRPLHEVTDPEQATSPFFNVFSRIDVGLLPANDAADFLSVWRPGIAPFSEEERDAVLTFAAGHPLALQVAAYHALEGRPGGRHLAASLLRAQVDMLAALPGWPKR